MNVRQLDPKKIPADLQTQLAPHEAEVYRDGKTWLVCLGHVVGRGSRLTTAVQRAVENFELLRSL